METVRFAPARSCRQGPADVKKCPPQPSDAPLHAEFFINLLKKDSNMTVGELIEELQSFDHDLPVFHNNDEEGNVVSHVAISFMSNDDADPVCVILGPGEEFEDEDE